MASVLQSLAAYRGDDPQTSVIDASPRERDASITGDAAWELDATLNRPVFRTNPTATLSYAETTGGVDPVVGLAAMTAAVWIYDSGTTDTFAGIVIARDPSLSVQPWGFTWETGGVVSFRLRPNNTAIALKSAAGGQPVGEWRLWIATWESGDEVKLYSASPGGDVNQVATTGTTYSGVCGGPPGSPLRFGNDRFSPTNRRFNGLVADAYVWPRVIMAGEMALMSDPAYRVPLAGGIPLPLLQGFI